MTPKIDFGNHFGLQNPPKIEEKLLKIVFKTMLKNKLEKKSLPDPLKKSVLAKEREER